MSYFSPISAAITSYIHGLSNTSSPSQHSSLDLTDRVEREGEHYVKMGEYADLWLGTLDKSVKVAVKVLRGGSSTNPQFLEDIRKKLDRNALIWRELKHPNVSGFLGIVTTWGYMPGLVLPLYHDTVVQYAEHQDETVKLDMARQIAEGLAYLHSKQLVHGDMRGANVLMDDEQHPRICDTGLTFIIEPSEFTSVKTAGACRWTAPELMSPSDDIENDPYALFTVATDMYAFDMLILEIFTGKIPFSQKKNDSSVIFFVLEGGRPVVPQEIIDIASLAELVQNCWDSTPAKRPTSRAAADALSSIASKLNGPSNVVVRNTGWFGRWL